MSNKTLLDNYLMFYVLGVLASSFLYHTAADTPSTMILGGVSGAIAGGFLARWLYG